MLLGLLFFWYKLFGQIFFLLQLTLFGPTIFVVLILFAANVFWAIIILDHTHFRHTCFLGTISIASDQYCFEPFF